LPEAGELEAGGGGGEGLEGGGAIGVGGAEFGQLGGEGFEVAGSEEFAEGEADGRWQRGRSR